MGILYNFHRSTNYGLLLTLGAVAPTGRVDDPDLLQDVGFGDGQWDAFLEFGGDLIWTDAFSSSAWFRYTHQFASEKELRIPTSSEFPLSSEKGTFSEKLGDIISIGMGSDYVLNDWTSVALSYSHTYRQKSTYYSEYALANQILAENSDSSKDVLSLSTTLSSITPFLKNNFLLPATLKCSYDKLLSGTNTVNHDMISFEFKMMF